MTILTASPPSHQAAAARDAPVQEEDILTNTIVMSTIRVPALENEAGLSSMSSGDRH